MSEFETNDHLPAKTGNIPPAPLEESADSFGEYIDFEDVQDKKPLIPLNKYAFQFGLATSARAAVNFIQESIPYGKILSIAEEGMTMTQNALIHAPYAIIFGAITPLAYALVKENKKRIIPYMLANAVFTSVASVIPQQVVKQYFKEQNQQEIQKKPEANPSQENNLPGIEYYNCALTTLKPQ